VTMADIAMIAATVGLFALAWAYVAWLERI
jgi:hypothetical protein